MLQLVILAAVPFAGPKPVPAAAAVELVKVIALPAAGISMVLAVAS